MERKLVAMTFALGLFGGIALATGVYQATVTETTSPVTTESAIAGGARIVGGDQAPPAPGHWIVSDAGVLTWVLDSAAPSGKTADAKWTAEREKAIADINREIECQLNGCDAP